MFLVGICHAADMDIKSYFKQCLKEKYSIDYMNVDLSPLLPEKFQPGKFDPKTFDFKNFDYKGFNEAIEKVKDSKEYKDATIYHDCKCNPSEDESCIMPDGCLNDKNTPNDLLIKYKDCGVQTVKKRAEAQAEAERYQKELANRPKQPEKEPEDGQIGGRCQLWRYCYGEARCENYRCVAHACKKEGEVPNGPDDKCCMPMVTRQGSPCKLLNTDHSDNNCNSHRTCQLNHEGRDYKCCYSHGRQNAPMCVPNKECKWGYLYSQ
ncbi:hypothetical protein O0I10_008367 [Lichtheimia ornata]|uniref:Uncharacterized protein n=1 Tax=Lichtheimia ornata TaxID=688661 RepID=A0AAD7XZJ3_9FUNG|nr:uncharacterized protein O0I10_008367 [Lichtheimia ornata]KAJ8655927.1 hypothetical protein O0I10_008367 [Lichtheimia ornata]